MFFQDLLTLSKKKDKDTLKKKFIFQNDLYNKYLFKGTLNYIFKGTLRPYTLGHIILIKS